MVNNYTKRFLKVILYLSRSVGVTYGGVTFSKTGAPSAKNQTLPEGARNEDSIKKLEFRRLKKDSIRISPSLKRIGYFFVLANLLSVFICHYSNFKFYNQFLSSLPTINKLLFLSTSFLLCFESTVSVFTAQFYGKEIIEFIADFALNCKQFLILIAVVVMMLLYFVAMLVCELTFWFSSDSSTWLLTGTVGNSSSQVGNPEGATVKPLLHIVKF